MQWESDVKASGSNKKFIGLGLAGALTTGFLASACCLTPLALALLGAGGAGYVAGFASSRPVFIALTVLFFALASYFTYRKPREASCSLKRCAVPDKKRGQKVFLWFCAALALALMFYPDILMRLG